MANRKLAKKIFSVEGETEQWYLYWLRDMINKFEEACYTVSTDCKIEKDPLKRAKSLVSTLVLSHLREETKSRPFYL